ncbi:MAG TPA: DUF2911 domain-containing protein [Phycisphaerae bacterium]|nr:DUF2911 domain-containing protein [Phycisphaerae bacterium]
MLSSMRPLTFCTLLAAAALTLPSLAQETPQRISPHETISTRLGRNLIEITYGRPYSKDPKTGEIRKIWGTLVPFGKLWRMGADEATLFLTPIDLTVGDTAIPAGTYSLMMQPEADGSAKLIFNKQTARWGIPITAAVTKDNLYTIDMKKSPLDKQIDQFTITLQGTPDKLTLNAQWENTQYAVEFAVKK